ncbi:hypothetical protein SKAU_G00201870 [Synaphobranchus kaupii]|uniref:unspecific monooxygenase n=1 Tax=Synaphobranchus kaupii TaxID=118154 RepID=A0A9Q1FFN5_SYNKA|nr:hypothetical protein SKAU_G00201870 [Synaphobranchus kaupii]
MISCFHPSPSLFCHPTMPCRVETWTLLITFICLLIAYGYWPYGFFKKLGIPGPKPSPFFGTLGDYHKGFLQMDMMYFKTYGRLWGFYEGRLPILSIMDTRMIKTVLVKECFSFFIDRRDFSFNGPLNDAISNARGEAWKLKRSVVSPMFSSGRIKEMVPLMQQHSDKLVQCLQGIANHDEAVEVREYFGSYTLDAVASIALSIDTDSFNNSNDPTVIKLKRAFTFKADNPGFLLSGTFIPQSRKKSLIEKKNVDKNRMDFLQLMLESQLPEIKHSTNENKQIKGLTHHEILSTALIFLAAGYETTSKSLAFLVYNLATNPGAMKKLQDEIDEVFPNKAPVTYEHLIHMEYLDMVLNESLRLYPIALRLERLCTETIVINGVTIPKGTVVMIPVYTLHRDPELWPEPECFNPERFSKENKDSMDPYAFLPFGAGPRNCVGMRFAVILMKLAIVQVLQNFSFAACKETEIPLQLDKLPLLGTVNPIKVKIVPLETWTLLITCICLLIAYGYWPYGFFKKLGIPGPKPSPFFGTFREYKKGFFQMDMMYFKTYGRLWGFYEGRLPILSIMDTRMIKTVLVKECFSFFIDRRDFPFNGPLKDAISNARGEAWKLKRSVVSPMFSSGRIKEMLPLMKQHSDKLVQCLQGIANHNEAVEVREYFGSYTLDAIASIALSIDTDSFNNSNDPTVIKLKRAFTFKMDNPGFLLSVLFPFLNPLLEKANLCIFSLADLTYLFSAIEKVKLDREKNVDKNQMDFLQLMLESQLPEIKHGTNENKQIKGLTHHEILSTSLIFLAAGFETTTRSLAFLVYNLATNPGAMKKLQDEIEEVFPNKAPVTYEHLIHMEYLDMVLNESLRLYPIALRLERLCTETIVINGVTIPKGTVVMIPVYTLHHDPELWPEPECFNPERFSKENKDSMDPYAFLPFGAGPRNCVGMRFAVILMKLAIVQVLQNFSFASCKETEIPLQLDKLPLLGTVNPIKVKIVPRGPIMKEE